ncbi:MAG TPA: 3'-5' exonuclease [Rectinemataceae bacterium]|nr:3'-5' exonuclease [Rectinemataceae bacterium]
MSLPEKGSPALPPDWRGRAYLALDFETTGLDPKLDRVVEIGAIRFRVGEDGKALEEGRISACVDPCMPISPAARAVNGISDEELVGAPLFSDFALPLLELGAGATIVAHNAPFDLAFLREELARSGLPEAPNEVLDTRHLAKAAFPARRGYRLTHLASDLALDTGRAHRALDDARTCMALFMVCAGMLDS